MIETRKTTETVQVTKERQWVVCDRCGAALSDGDEFSPKWGTVLTRDGRLGTVLTLKPGDLLDLCPACVEKVVWYITKPDGTLP